MKMKIKYVSLIAFAASFAQAQSTSHGGNACEEQFKHYALNIRNWIQAGGSNALHFKEGGSVSDYNQKMLAIIDPLLDQKEGAITIDCKDEKLYVNQVEKDCIWAPVDLTKPDGLKHVTCNREAYLGKDPSAPNDRVQLHDTHHEIAGIAGLETNQGSNSDYFYTDQVSSHGKWVLHYDLLVENVVPASPYEALVDDLIQAYYRHQNEPLPKSPTVLIPTLRPDEDNWYRLEFNLVLEKYPFASDRKTDYYAKKICQLLEQSQPFTVKLIEPENGRVYSTERNFTFKEFKDKMIQLFSGETLKKK